MSDTQKLRLLSEAQRVIWECEQEAREAEDTSDASSALDELEAWLRQAS